MYCVDYQMSYPLLVVPYAPQQHSKALESQSLSRAFFLRSQSGDQSDDTP